jgi:hypothetical protein
LPVFRGIHGALSSAFLMAGLNIEALSNVNLDAFCDLAYDQQECIQCGYPERKDYRGCPRRARCKSRPWVVAANWKAVRRGAKTLATGDLTPAPQSLTAAQGSGGNGNELQNA